MKKSRRAFPAIGWMLPVALAWGALMVLSHRPTTGAVIWTDRLFGCTIAITYLSVMRWLIAIYRTSRLVMFRWLALNLALAIVWLGLELVAALNLVNWRLVFDRMVGNGLLNYQYATGFLSDRDLEFRRLPGAHWAGPVASDLEWEWSVPPVNPRPLSFQYDRWGYRNPTNRGHADVALIGDSFVEGWYVQPEETAAQNHRRLRPNPVRVVETSGASPPKTPANPTLLSSNPPSRASDRNLDWDSDGRTNLEVYLNRL